VSSTPLQDQESDGDENGTADDSIQADALNEVIMAIDMSAKGNLGCAYYVATEEALFLLEDVAMASSEIVETLLLHVRPTTVLAPARTAQNLLDILAAGADGEDGVHRHREHTLSWRVFASN
jgi:DNA mismatch repair protein MSH5